MEKGANPDKEIKVLPIEIKCKGAEKVKLGDYVLYHIQVSIGDKSLILKKRFSDILRDLHQPVGKVRNVDGPSRHVFETMSGQSPEFIKSRAQEIDTYINTLLKIPGVTVDPIFANFFQLYNLEEKSVTQKRQEIEYQRLQELSFKKNIPIRLKDNNNKIVQINTDPTKSPKSPRGEDPTKSSKSPRGEDKDDKSNNNNNNSGNHSNDNINENNNVNTSENNNKQLPDITIIDPNTPERNRRDSGRRPSNNSSKNVRIDADGQKSPRGENDSFKGESKHVSPIQKTRGKSIGSNAFAF